MPKFHYIAHDINGEEKSGTVNAPNEPSAIEQLKKKGLFPKEVTGIDLHAPSIEPVKKAGAGLGMNIHLPAALTPIKTKQLMILTRQMATLIHAGLPLLRGLQILERQEKNTALKKTLNNIAESIESGSTFTDALAQHPRIFNTLYINMVKAGEAGGILDVVLDRLAAYMEKAEKIKNKVKSAMTYPIVVLLASTSILIFLMVAIIPRFEQIFADMLEGQSLPPLTLFVMEFSERILNEWPIWFGMISFVILLIAAAKRFKGGRVVLDSIKLSTPLFGNLSRMSALARLSRTLGTLMHSGVPILQALTIVKAVFTNEIFSAAVQDIHDNIKEGESMIVPVEANRIFPPIFAGMIEIGEETGELPAMLLKVADMYEDEVDNAVAGLSSIIEPVLIVLLAVVVGTIVIAMFLPMVSIIGNLA